MRIAKLDISAFIARLENINAEIIPRVNESLRAEAQKLVSNGFRKSVDPYGNAWAPLKHRRGQPLLDTGRLRASFAARVLPDGIVVGTNVEYAAVHQTGATIKAHERQAQSLFRSEKSNRFISPAKAFTKKTGAVRKGITALTVLPRTQSAYMIPQRAMVPIAGAGLGNWGVAFEKIIAKTFRKGLGQE
jgi:phage gpG-like protein